MIAAGLYEGYADRGGERTALLCVQGGIDDSEVLPRPRAT